MTTLLYTHPLFLGHQTGAGHPESPERLKAVAKALCAPEFDRLERRQAPAATEEQLRLIHTEAHVRRVFNAVPKSGLAHLDADTVLSPESGQAALHAAGAVCAGVDALMADEARNVFCALRPPGHHAEPGEAMGFCLFNNIAIGAAHARQRHGLRRVAIVDFDVHHGNGTQAAFADKPEVLYASTHQSPWYPGTGRASETGAGNIVNVPLAGGAGSTELRAAFTGTILPRLEQFRPELLLISAGFDAHSHDPLGGLNFEDGDYAWMTEALLDIAHRYCKDRLVSALEGGYELEALGRSVEVHVRALMAFQPGANEPAVST